MREIVKSVWKHKWSNLLTMLQLVLVITYFFITLVSIQSAFNVCIEVPKVFGDKINHTIHVEVQFEGVDEEDFQKFCTELKEKHIVNEIITFDSSDFESHELSDDRVGNLKIQPEMNQVKELELEEGRGFEKEDLKRETLPVLVGSQLAKQENLKVGDIIKEYHRDETYEIIGILKKDSRWFQNPAANGTIILLDRQVVTLTDEEFVRQHYYCNADFSNKDEVVSDIKSIANKYNVVCQPTLLNDELNEKYNEIIDDNIYWLVFSIVMIIMITIGTATLSITQMYARKKEIGIRMAVGYTTGKIVMLFAGEIILTTLMAYIVSCMMGMLLIGNGISEWPSGTVTYSGYVFSGEIALLGAVAAVCMCTPAVITLLIQIKKYQPKNLIGGRE